MKIRWLKKNEVNVVGKIVRKNYSRKWEEVCRPEVEAMFNQKTLNPKYLVVEEDKKIIGFGGYCTSWMDYEVKEIFWVNILPRSQGKGLGHILIREMINKIKKDKSHNYKTRLIILSCMSKLVKFYSEFGFKKILQLSKNEYLMGLKL